MRSWSERFQAEPIRTGAVAGFLIAMLALLSAATFALVFYFMDLQHPTHDGAGWSLLTGFIIGPIVAFAGLPWSFLVIKTFDNPYIAVAGLAVSVLINGTIIGCFVGMRAESRGRRDRS
jgi:hypothetical protein